MELLDSPRVDEGKWGSTTQIPREELRRRAVRRVLDGRDKAGGSRSVCTRVGQQLGVPQDTVCGWVHQAHINEGARPGTTTDEPARLVALDREVKELRQANEFLKAESAFFAAELEGRLSR
jgi:transposase